MFHRGDRVVCPTERALGERWNLDGETGTVLDIQPCEHCGEYGCDETQVDVNWQGGLWLFHYVRELKRAVETNR